MRAWVCLIVLLLSSFHGFARAEGRARDKRAEASADPAAPAGYEETTGRALTEFDLGNYAEARSDLLEAHRMYPNARTLRALGMVEFELKNYASSSAYLEQALASAVRALTPEQRGEVQALLNRAQGYIGWYRVSLRPQHATLLIDGERAALDPDGVLVLSVGDHELEAVADGHRALRRTLRVAGGQHERIDLVLMPAPQVDARGPAADPASSTRTDTPVYKRWWLWTTVGLVVAAGAMTGIVLATRTPEPKEPRGGSLNQVVHLLEWK